MLTCHSAEQGISLGKDRLENPGQRSPKRLKVASTNGNVDASSTRDQSTPVEAGHTFLKDVSSVADALIEGLKEREANVNSAVANKNIKQIEQSRRSVTQSCNNTFRTEESSTGTAGSLSNGELEKYPTPAMITLTSQTDRGPRTLFSGLPLSKSDGAKDKTQDVNMLDAEASGNWKPLPTGMSFARSGASLGSITNVDDYKQARTFGEVFRPSRSLKSLEPPRLSRNAVRGSNLDWISNEESAMVESSVPTFKSDNRYIPLPTGHWLQYTSIDPSAALTPESKRRQRNRGLSFNENRPEPVEDSGESENMKTRALFQSAYSSFAPSYDNSAAALTEGTRSQAWWSKIGRKRYEASLAFQYPDLEADGLNDPVDQDVDMDDDFEAMVTNFEDEVPANPIPTKLTPEMKDTDDTLQDISDLLQTLSSYQRIRNLSKDTADAVKPKPGEVDTYEILKSSLSILVSSLPPFAVAKLDGDQLAALNINSTILVENSDHTGTMEHDVYSLERQKAMLAATHVNPALSAIQRPAVSTPTTARTGSYSAQMPVQHQRNNVAPVNRTPPNAQAQRVSSFASANNTPQNYSAARQTPMNMQRPGFPSQLHYPNQTYSQGANASQFQRPASGTPNGYNSAYGTHAQRASAQAYAQQRPSPAGYSHPLSQSPQKSVQSPQSAAARQAQQYSPQRPSPQQIQGKPAVAYAVGNQIAMTDQAKAQLFAAQQARLAGTNGQITPVGRASTPGGGTPNGRPAVAAGSQGQ